MEVYSPVPTSWLVEPEAARRERTPPGFGEGMVVGILDNGKLRGFAEALERQLLAHGAREVRRWTKHYQDGAADQALVEEIASLVDSAVVGLGN